VKQTDQLNAERLQDGFEALNRGQIDLAASACEQVLAEHPNGVAGQDEGWASPASLSIVKANQLSPQGRSGRILAQPNATKQPPKIGVIDGADEFTVEPKAIVPCRIHTQHQRVPC
jgi:hypothetical protein